MSRDSLLEEKMNMDYQAQMYCNQMNSFSGRVGRASTLGSVLFIASPVFAGMYLGSLLGGFPRYYVETLSANRVESLEINNGKLRITPKMPVIAKYNSTKALDAKIVGSCLGLFAGSSVQGYLLHMMNIKDASYDLFNPVTAEIINNGTDILSRFF